MTTKRNWSRKRRFEPKEICDILDMFLNFIPRKIIRKKYQLSQSHLQKILERKIYKDVKL